MKDVWSMAFAANNASILVCLLIVAVNVAYQSRLVARLIVKL